MMMKRCTFLTLLAFALASLFTAEGIAQGTAEEPWVVYEGGNGPGSGKHIVFVTGDEEYRSEEAMPMLARILAEHHGFRCTVLFAIDPATGEINPDHQTNIPGLEQLASADLMVLFTRFRELPDEQMKHIVDYTNSGKPIVGLRTATHAFNYTRNPESPYARYDFRSEDPEGGYGRAVLGETWINHHGDHGEESMRGLVNGPLADHPILRGVEDIWVPTDVYGVRELTGDPDVLIFGQVLQDMEPTSMPNFDKAIMPVAWTKDYTGETGNTARVFNTTMGSSVDLQNEGLRRLLVNAAYWGMGMEDQIPEAADVAIVGDYDPTFYGFGAYQEGVKPSDLMP